MSRESPSTRRVQELRAAFHAVIRGFGILDASKTPCGKPLSISQAHALMEILHRPLANQGELAAALGLSKSATSRMLASMDEHGWIERTQDEHDGRAMRLQLTARGHRVAVDVDQASLSRFGRMLSAIPDASRLRVISALQVLARSLAVENATTNTAGRADG